MYCISLCYRVNLLFIEHPSVVLRVLEVLHKRKHFTGAATISNGVVVVVETLVGDSFVCHQSIFRVSEEEEKTVFHFPWVGQGECDTGEFWILLTC